MDPLPAKGTRVTWLKTDEGASQQYGTLALLIEFPEPVDWERTGIEVSSFKGKVAGESADLDLLNLPAASQFGIQLYWVRSLDGARLLIIPKLTRTRTYQPTIVLAENEPALADRLTMIRAGAAVSLSEIIEEIKSASVDLTTEHEASDMVMSDNGSVESETAGEIHEAETAVSRASFIGDVAIAAPSSVDDRAEIIRIVDTFGALIIENISGYQVSDLQLKFSYLADNYEKKKKANINFRAIPRLNYWKGSPGDAKDYIGTLRVLSTST